MRRSVAGLVVVLVVLAGCSTVDVPLDGPGTDWQGDPDNPYRQSTLVVGLAVETDGSRDYEPLVRSALDYWEDRAEQYAGYPVDYDLRPDADRPDVRVTVVDEVDCGAEPHAAGCAPVVEAHSQFDPPVSVRVVDGLSDASTVDVLTHEVGHTLGLDHGDAPQSVMAPERDLATLPRTDATARAVPWADDRFTVFVDVRTLPADERDAARRQVAAALDYFAAGAGGTVPENVTFVRTADRSAAEVTVVATGSLSCQSGGGSCGSLAGVDPDGDGALERYDRLEITFADLDVEAVGWHVGRWLGRGFGFEAASDYPPPLREDASHDERRSDWWAEG